jgi:hypothetical protein
MLRLEKPRGQYRIPGRRFALPWAIPCAPLGQKTIGHKTIVRYLGAKRDAR